MPRRRRKGISWAGLVAAALAANVAAGLWASDATAVRRVRVLGAPKGIENRVRQIVRELQGVPYARVNEWEVEWRLERLPEVRAATLQRNLFGSATIRIRARRPVASIQGEEHLYLDETGALFRCEGLTPPTIALALPPEARSPLGSFATGWPSANTAQLCAALGEISGLEGGTVEFHGSGSVSFRPKRGAAVAFGSTEGVDVKVEKLAELLRSRPRLLEEVRSLNLTVPERAQIVP